MKRTEAIGRLDAAVVSLYEKLSSWEESVADQVGLTPRQCHTVAELGRTGRIRMKPLSERLGITTGTMTIMADRLQKLKLARRAEDPSDRRAFYLELTEAGQRLSRRHAAHHAQLTEELLSTLSDEEAERFIPMLEKMMQVL